MYSYKAVTSVNNPGARHECRRSRNVSTAVGACGAWLEDGQIKSKTLTPDLKNPVGKFEKLLDVGLNNYGYMVGLLKGVPARVLKMEEGGIFVKL